MRKPRIKLPGRGEILSIRYSREDALSAQHSAGIAGLLLLAQWVEEHDHVGVVACQNIDEQGFTLDIDMDGLWSLRDALYTVAPVKIKEGKEEKEIFLPACPVIRDLDPSPTGAYLAIYGWGTFGSIYGRPKQRTEFENRSPGGGGDCSLGEQLKLLAQPEEPVTVTSTYLWGANRQPDGSHKAHIEKAKMKFALQAKSLVCGFYPIEATADAKDAVCRNGPYWKQHGWVMVVPDIRDLKEFLRVYKSDCVARPVETKNGSSYPDRAKVVHVEEAVCEYALGVRGKVFALEATHIYPNETKEATNGQWFRLMPPEERIDQYLRSRKEGEGKVLRWCRSESIITGWSVERLFTEAMTTMAPEQTSESGFYRRDARKVLKETLERND
jgi:hypothetical protein